MGTQATAQSTRLRKAATIAIAAALALCASMAFSLALTAGKAWAGGTPPLEELQNKTLTISYKGKAHDMGYRDFHSMKSPKKKITNAKSTNTKVATVKVSKNYGYYSLRVTLKKPGTTKIKFKFNGKNYTGKLVVKKYVSPVKSYKVGKKNYASLFKPANLQAKSCYYNVPANVKAKGFSGVVKIVPANGWKVGSVFYTTNQGSGYIKNGKSVKNAYSVQAMLVNKKTKQFDWLSIYANDFWYTSA